MKKTYSFTEEEMQVIADYLFNAIDDGVHTISMTHEAHVIRSVLEIYPERNKKGIDTCTAMLKSIQCNSLGQR